MLLKLHVGAFLKKPPRLKGWMQGEDRVWLVIAWLLKRSCIVLKTTFSPIQLIAVIAALFTDWSSDFYMF